MKKVLATLILAAAASQGAVEKDICLALDGSSSMGSANFDIQKNATADTIENATFVPADGTVAISVIQFGSSAQLEVSRTVIDSPATATVVANQIRAISYADGFSTHTEAAITLCQNSLVLGDSAKHIIDISTDGNPESLSDTITSADNAITAGVNVINALGTGPQVNPSQLNQIVRPQPVSVIPDDGFVVLVPDFNSYEEALQQKLSTEAGGVPPSGDPSGDPGTPQDSVSVPLGAFANLMLMMMFGLFGFAKLRRRS